MAGNMDRLEVIFCYRRHLYAVWLFVETLFLSVCLVSKVTYGGMQQLNSNVFVPASYLQ